MNIERDRATNVVVVTCTPEELHVLQAGNVPPGGTPVGKAAMKMIERVSQAQGRYLRDGMGAPIEI